jgi:hypothetical protein
MINLTRRRRETLLAVEVSTHLERSLGTLSLPSPNRFMSCYVEYSSATKSTRAEFATDKAEESNDQFDENIILDVHT